MACQCGSGWGGPSLGVTAVAGGVTVYLVWKWGGYRWPWRTRGGLETDANDGSVAVTQAPTPAEIKGPSVEPLLGKEPTYTVVRYGEEGTEQYIRGGKKGSKKDGVGGGLVCAHCKKVGELDTMKRCGRCRLACYCSAECQKLHWKSGGHKKVCGKEGSSGDRSDGVPGASGGGGAALKHPCPICLDSEDDAGDQPGMCSSCGQLFCGSCKKSLEQRGVTNCPTCRAFFHVPPKENEGRLRQLLARPTGRHTPIAQFNLGACYGRGSGVPQDDAEAVRWYRLAADQGHKSAQFNLGGCYSKGTGVVQDKAEALRWLRLAANQGHAGAHVNIGAYYMVGTGVAQDAAEAVRWFRVAADRGLASAQFNVAKCYRRGTGVAQDRAESLRWYCLAADQGHADAQTAIAELGM